MSSDPQMAQFSHFNPLYDLTPSVLCNFLQPSHPLRRLQSHIQWFHNTSHLPFVILITIFLSAKSIIEMSTYPNISAPHYRMPVNLFRRCEFKHCSGADSTIVPSLKIMKYLCPVTCFKMEIKIWIGLFPNYSHWKMILRDYYICSVHCWALYHWSVITH